MLSHQSDASDWIVERRQVDSVLMVQVFNRQTIGKDNEDRRSYFRFVLILELEFVVDHHAECDRQKHQQVLNLLAPIHSDIIIYLPLTIITLFVYL